MKFILQIFISIAFFVSPLFSKVLTSCGLCPICFLAMEATPWFCSIQRGLIGSYQMTKGTRTCALLNQFMQPVVSISRLFPETCAFCFPYHEVAVCWVYRLCGSYTHDSFVTSWLFFKVWPNYNDPVSAWTVTETINLSQCPRLLFCAVCYIG